jgi:glycosyltransferase involved in cell wall biosynthesis
MARTPLTVFTAHHSHELPFHGRKLIWADRLCAGPLSDLIIAPSAQVRKTLLAFTHVAPEKIAVVHHGFDLEALDPASNSGAAIRSEMGLDDQVVIGAIGRIYAIKNYEALITAFSRMLGDLPRAHLMIVGPGDPRPLVELSERLGIAGRVSMTGPRPNVPELLAAFDAFAHPSRAESFGMVIIEAMAAGKPVLSTPVGIAPEVIRDGQNGVLCRGCDVTALEEGLRRLIHLRPQWPVLGEAARACALSFDAGAMSQAYTALYTAGLRAERPEPGNPGSIGANGSVPSADS